MHPSLCRCDLSFVNRLLSQPRAPRQRPTVPRTDRTDSGGGETDRDRDRDRETEPHTAQHLPNNPPSRAPCVRARPHATQHNTDPVPAARSKPITTPTPIAPSPSSATVPRTPPAAPPPHAPLKALSSLKCHDTTSHQTPPPPPATPAASASAAAREKFEGAAASCVSRALFG